MAATAGVTSTRIRAFPGDYRDVLDWSEMKARRPLPILERARAEVRHELRYRRPASLRINRLTIDLRHGYPPVGERVEIVHHGGGYVLGVR